MRVGVLVIVLLGLGACTEAQPEAVRPEPVPSATPSATPHMSPAATPTEPTNYLLGMALPTRQDVAVHDFTSCVTGVDVCDADSSKSWVRAGDGVEVRRASRAARWVEITVGRPGVPARSSLRQARYLCTEGDFVLPPDGRGFDPRPETWKGTGEERSVEHGGFRGVQCDTVMGPVGGVRTDWHWIRAVRDDVLLEVTAHSEALTVRLFEQYVDRLGWSV